MVGARVLAASGDVVDVRADAVVLATGGSGCLYPHTTNPEVATGDGIAAALRAGAERGRPGVLPVPPDGARRAGHVARLRGGARRGRDPRRRDGERFMLDANPDGELAPRDVVARAIARQMAAQGGRPCSSTPPALGAAFLARRFPLDAACREAGSTGRRARPGHPRRALPDGRRHHRPRRAHDPARPLRRRRGRPHRRARREPARLQLAAGGGRVRRPGGARARRRLP